MNLNFTKSYLLVLFFSFSFSAIIYAQSVGGTVSGATAVCPNSTNSGFLMLNGYTGTILYWESSIDGGINWINIGNPINSYSYSNLTQTTCYRAIVKSGIFPPDTSTVACITIITPSVGGTITPAGAFCVSAPGDTLTLSGYVGSIVNWQYSVNGGISWTTVPDTTNTLVYTTLTQTTIYQAIVQNGTGCPADTSSQAVFTIDPVSVAGTMAGAATVCYGANTGTLTVSGMTGTISGWITSVDGGVTWSSISNTTSAQNYTDLTQTTLFGAIVQSGTCTADTAFELITVRPPVTVDAGPDTTLLNGQSVVLSGSGNGTALWTPSTGLNNDTLFAPLAMPALTTLYILTVTDTNGCSNKDSVLVTVNEGEFTGVVTTLFTPDGDGVNDTWYIEGIQNFPANEVTVFNIYGNKVFEQKAYVNDWKGTFNGSPLPDGTYYYVLKFDDSSSVIKGSLDILRNK